MSARSRNVLLVLAALLLVGLAGVVVWRVGGIAPLLARGGPASPEFAQRFQAGPGRWEAPWDFGRPGHTGGFAFRDFARPRLSGPGFLFGGIRALGGLLLVGFGLLIGVLLTLLILNAGRFAQRAPAPAASAAEPKQETVKSDEGS